MKNFIKTSAVLMSLFLLFSGCGGSSSDENNTTQETATLDTANSTDTNNSTLVDDKSTLSLDTSTLTISSGNTGVVTATATTDGSTSDTVSAESSNTSVAAVSVSSNIITVTGVSSGSAVVTISSSSGKTATCNVTITENEVSKSWAQVEDLDPVSSSFDVKSYNNKIYTVSSTFNTVSLTSYDGTTKSDMAGTFYDGSDTQPIYQAIDPSDGTIYVLATHSKQLADASLYKYDGSSTWSELATGFSDFSYGEGATYYKLFIINTEPFVVFHRSNTIYIKKFSSNSWVDVTTITQSDTNYSLYLSQVTYDENANIYIAYSNNGNFLTKISSTGTKTALSLSGFNGSFTESLAYNNNKLYVAYDDGSAGAYKTTVESFDLTTSAWSTLGTKEFSGTSEYGSKYSFGFDNNNKPYISLWEKGSYLYYLYVYSFDSTEWSKVGDYLATSGSTITAPLLYINNDMYVYSSENGYLFTYK